MPTSHNAPPFSDAMLVLTPATCAAVLRQAAARLLAGAVAVIPTDTVYGLAAHPACAAAVARLGCIKGRDAAKPIALLAADIAAVERAGALLPPLARTLAGRFWPGALTLVLDCGACREGFRVPAHQFCRDLLTACGGALRVTSANLSGAQPALSAAQALADVGLVADFVVDDGPAAGGVASSVVRVDAANRATLLRAGALTATVMGLPPPAASNDA